MGQTLTYTVLWEHPHDSTSPSSIKYSFNGSVDKPGIFKTKLNNENEFQYSTVLKGSSLLPHYC
jgi:hypothetical protein